MTSVRWDTFAWLLALRTPANARPTTTSMVGSESPAASLSGPASGQAARWTEPSCHHDQTSSVAKGRNGASSLSCTDRAARKAVTADARAALSPL